ncbi:MAG: protein translocase subunit SecF [Candidatus Paceibacterota bacterium]|jgi:preprotein translocase subunit SecF
MWIINNRKIFYTISGILVLASIVSVIIWGLKPGIDFSGGTLIDISYSSDRPSQGSVIEVLSSIDKNVSVRPSGDTDFIIRMKTINEDEHATIKQALNFDNKLQFIEKTFDSVGPVLGEEAMRKAYWSIIFVILGIVLYITFAFRKVSEPISSWKYGLIVVASLMHDVIIPIGVFSVLGHFFGYEVDTLFITALLVILGFSVHDTIVVFDRVRENLKNATSNKSFATIVGSSISQTFTRSINTSLTTLIALIVLYFVGGETTQHFTLALIIGIAFGTYSSIFIASPLLVTIEKWKRAKK